MIAQLFRTYDLIADLPVKIERYELEPLERATSSEFTRYTTVIRLYGGGHEGIGEDVCYGEGEQKALQQAGAILELAGTHTLDSLSHLLTELELFPEPPEYEPSPLYRRWAFESAALDLGLCQAGISFAQALEREPRPVNFVCSLRLGEPPSIAPLAGRLADYPELKFKLDPTSSWDGELIAELAATGAVATVDFKGLYHGSIVDQAADPELYQAIAEAFPEAWIEDPALTPETERVLEPWRDRITWDAPIHSLDDILALPYPPRALNFKPSRLGPISSLLDCYDYCQQNGIAIYGGGQFELGPGRGQIQYLASLLYPDGPNDVAPGGYNDPQPAPGLPRTPLAPATDETGFRWLP